MTPPRDTRSEMLKSVEAAIYEHFDPFIPVWDCPQGAALELAAQAVLAILSAPTKEMIQDGYTACRDGMDSTGDSECDCDMATETTVLLTWRAMLDAVLKPVSAPESTGRGAQ